MSIMEKTAPPVPRTARLRQRVGHLPLRAVVGWTTSFALVTYLAFSDGGFDTIPRGQVGVVVWWIVLLVAAIGIFPRRLGRPGWTAFALLAGFAVWTGLSIAWSESAELSADELGRVTTYAGVLLLALAIVRWSGRRPVLNGAASAVGLVGLLAVLSRLHPTWFPINQQLVFFKDTRRLTYPINYWNGLAAFLAMGVPLLLGLAATARTFFGRALAAAGVPVLALGIFFTVSRGGVIALVVGLAAYLLLTHDRLAAIASVAVCGGGAAILIAYANARPILQHGLRSPAAISAGDRMLPVLLIACIAVALVQTGIWLVAHRLPRPRWLRPSGRQGAVWVGAVIAALVLVAVFAGAPGRIEHAWRDFKRPPGAVSGPSSTGNVFVRLQSAAGNDRYQYWKVAARAASEHPLEGIGAGTFVLLWARNANAPGHVQDAHSLYMQTLAENGYPGLVLIAALVLTLLLAGAWRAIRSRPETRVMVAAATAGAAVYCTSAVYEWVWQLAAVTVLVLLLGAVSLAGEDTGAAARAETGADERPARSWRSLVKRLVPRALLVAGACGALVAVSLPLAEAQDVARSQAAFSRGEYRSALADARSAMEVQPYSTSAVLQEALVLEKTGDYSTARAAAVKATEQEPTNWQTWIILSRIESELGRGRVALADFARAHRLDPEGALFRP
jgi:tetratricopeptide (TPR) repeat protein